LHITDISYSGGWLQRFKHQHEIANHVLNGGIVGVDPQLISDGQERSAAFINDNPRKNIKYVPLSIVMA
jgi:hypothetical protein